jgi:6-pyruvoyltetrahydropterin/6-carboxytetrahydropterin synthase
VSWEIIVKQKFSAAHYLENYKGKCEKMHGHTFEIEVVIGTSELDKAGISFDFSQVKAYLKSILPDHQVLNDIFDFSPSAENLARYFYYKIREKYPVVRVIIWESEQAAAVFSES